MMNTTVSSNLHNGSHQQDRDISIRKVLLLNASNKEDFPVYPYAFIQVPAIARRVGIDVVCKDLLGIPQDQWTQTIKAMIKQHTPSMILIALRNTDALVTVEYKLDDSKEGVKNAYFPIERTRELITTVRKISDLKIAVGGFGFSLLPNELMHHWRTDFGVAGGPDDFFVHFDNILNGHLDNVANLMFFRGNQVIENPRALYPPLASAEYTLQAIQALMEFYTACPSPGFQGAPVEILRGCSHSCVFCAEPHSLGKLVRYRELSAIMEDIQILADHDVTRLYFISSELNSEGNESILELADRIHSFNETQAEDQKVTWFGANYLLKFSADEYERLYQGGFTGGWYDITALDDENARAMRTPYRNNRLLAHLKTYAESTKKQLDLRRTHQALGINTGVSAGDGRDDELIRWSMFLGNSATTIETIRRTIQIANQEGLSTLFDACWIVGRTREFDYEEPDEATLAVTYSVSEDLKRTGYNQLLPSFAYPPALLREFSEKEIAEMFEYIAKTHLSKCYQRTRDWCGFVRQNATAESVARWMAELSDTKGIRIPDQTSAAATLQNIFLKEARDEEKCDDGDPAKQIVYFLLSACLDAFPSLFDLLGFPNTMEMLGKTTPYELARTVFNKWQTEQELISEITSQTRSTLSESMQRFVQFCVRAMLYKFNIQVNSKYRALFLPVRLMV